MVASFFFVFTNGMSLWVASSLGGLWGALRPEALCSQANPPLCLARESGPHLSLGIRENPGCFQEESPMPVRSEGRLAFGLAQACGAPIFSSLNWAMKWTGRTVARSGIHF